MKRIKLIIVFLLLVLTAVSMKANISQDLCSAFEEGYNQAAEDCFRVASVIPCPIFPVNIRTEKSAYGYGYALSVKNNCKK